MEARFTKIDQLDLFLNRFNDDKMALVIDENVHQHHGAQFKSYKQFIVPSGEEHKNIKTLEKMISFLMEQGLDRHSTILGVGGGVVCDLTGFVASIYLRGISFGFLPTTLLAMCDAAIGGKNGVNFRGNKNIIGIIRQADFIGNHFPFLKTLPDKEYINGMAEVIKHALLDSTSFMRFLEENHENIISKDSIVLEEMVLRSQSIKEGIVNKDLYEKKERKKLNLGHTIGHAIEAYTGMAHGQSISIGTVLAAKISHRMGICNESFVEEVEKLFRLFGLPTNAKMDYTKLIGHVKFDKKRNDQKVDFVVPIKPGHVDIIPVSFDDLMDHIKTITNG